MGRLVCAGITSLDGYISDADGSFAWAMPDEELHGLVNELESGIGTYLYGRRMYEVMSFWEAPDLDGEPEVFREYAGIWQAADKVVYSSTLDAATTARTRLEKAFDADAVRELVASSDRDVSIGGPTLAAHAFAAGLVDDVRMFVQPVAVGGGTPLLPPGQRIDLELVEEQRLRSGVVHLHYRVARR